MGGSMLLEDSHKDGPIPANMPLMYGELASVVSIMPPRREVWAGPVGNPQDGQGAFSQPCPSADDG